MEKMEGGGGGKEKEKQAGAELCQAQIPIEAELGKNGIQNKFQ